MTEENIYISLSDIIRIIEGNPVITTQKLKGMEVRGNCRAYGNAPAAEYLIADFMKLINDGTLKLKPDDNITYDKPIVRVRDVLEKYGLTRLEE